MSRRSSASLLLLLGACATPATRSYSERCTDSARPCSLSYDFEPSGVARDVFSDADAERYLVVNEDGVVFSWSLGPKNEWDHDHVSFARSIGDKAQKLESAASAICDGTPVFLAATNFAPGRKGPKPERQRVVALAGEVNAPARVLEQTSRVISSLPAKYGASAVKVEGLALSPDCKTLSVGVRSALGADGSERFVTDIYPITLDVDWKGTRESATLSEALPFSARETCSGQPEGISSLEALRDGSLLVLTSFERETKARTKPEEVATAELAGSLWKRAADGTVTRLACFPGHKPEALAVSADERTARVLFEDDDYGGRPIRAYAVKVTLP